MDKEKNGFRNDPHDRERINKKVNYKESSKNTSLKSKNIADPHDPDHTRNRLEHFKNDYKTEIDTPSISRTADPHDPEHPRNH
ncbi:hypothetical protein [Facklamia sp. 7083-14-GEN3]|uniref:hypothetical protein n=1 Tax=Facklamia sp. 7083-14-GEN3 TaxID=2973478 RepID=UPI00215CDF47|nr:hypothetical protein [Facklamia sp. 7083-14-GEN3]MCR8968482.1 hypothetical protein [Facklamia sp. 7083-14-GEN3]